MVDYRLYCQDAGGNISFADWIEAVDDDDAVRQARLLKQSARRCEVWQGNRLVASLDAPELAIHATKVPPRESSGKVAPRA